jgi:RNA polymerase sigma factor (sigma-70 family)
MSVHPLRSTQFSTRAEPSDERYALLIQRIARCDEDAFKAFYEATMPRVYGLALAITKSPDIAEDVVIDVFLRVWRHAEKYDDKRGRPLTWLLVMCRSRALDALVGRRAVTDDAALLRAEVQDEPEHLLSVLEQECTIAQALKRLSATQRRLIDLAFFRGLSHGEIAAAVGMPLGTVKTHIRKGLKTLESLLAESGSGNG